MKFSLRKGEYFTKRDVVCPYCGAGIGEPCVSRSARADVQKRAAYLRENRSQYEHKPRGNLFDAWEEYLLDRKLIERRIPSPSMPYWAKTIYELKPAPQLGSRYREAILYIKKTIHVTMGPKEVSL